MQEILFKGKRKDNGEWIEGHLLWYEDGRARIIPRHTDIFCYENDENIIQTVAYEVIPETVGQYTGLPDKNGKKIFEEDIVAHFINWHGKRFNGVVRYESKIACWVCDFVVNNKTESAYLADWVHGNGAEVIGNIHDNPELLKEADNE